MKRFAVAVLLVLIAIVALLGWSGMLPLLYPGGIRMELPGKGARVFWRPLAELQDVDGYLELQGFHYIDPDTEELVFLSVPAPTKDRRYFIGASGSDSGWAAYFTRQVRTDRTTSYHTDDSHHGTVVITRFDRFLHIVEGTFEFDAFRKEDNRVLAVRKGKFSAMYRGVPASVYDTAPQND